MHRFENEFSTTTGDFIGTDGRRTSRTPDLSTPMSQMNILDTAVEEDEGPYSGPVLGLEGQKVAMMRRAKGKAKADSTNDTVLVKMSNIEKHHKEHLENSKSLAQKFHLLETMDTTYMEPEDLTTYRLFLDGMSH